MRGEEADAADHWRIPLHVWYADVPRWARAGMVAQCRKRTMIARWLEIWSDDG